MITTPILVIGYNRPSIARTTLNILAESSPTKVYFAIDGPKDEKDRVLVGMVKEIFHSEINEAQCVYYENESNLGPEITITNAISEVFKTEDRLIILEDDVIAPYSFLSFAETMLDRYVNDDRISMITGSNWAEASSECNQDYFFAYLGNTLSGWATWKRAWEDFSLYDDFKISKKELQHRFRNKNLRRFFYNNYRAFSRIPRGINTWDCCWQYRRIKNNGLSIIPSKNLTSNIGTYGTHFTGESSFHNIPFDKSFQITGSINDVVVNYAWDDAIYEKFLSTNFWGRVTSCINLYVKLIQILCHEYRKQL